MKYRAKGQSKSSSIETDLARAGVYAYKLALTQYQPDLLL